MTSGRFDDDRINSWLINIETPTELMRDKMREFKASKTGKDIKEYLRKRKRR